MVADALGFEPLQRSIERLIDSDRILLTAGEALLENLDDARRALEAGEVTTGAWYLGQVAGGLEALIRCGQLDPSDGNAPLAAARRLLGE